MEFDKLVITALALVVLGAFTGMLADSYIASKKDLEFAKLGYVQKVESNKVIWVKQ